MSYLNNLEYDYVLGDTKIFREFDSSHFISNAKAAVTNKVQTVEMNMKFNYYTSMLEKAINSFSVIKLDKETVTDFLSRLNTMNKLDAANLVVNDIIDYDNISFKPQYIGQYTNLVGGLIDKAINGDVDQSEVTKYMTGEIPEKVTRQVVKSVYPYGVDVKTLIKEKSLKTVKVDTAYVKTKVLPFVMKYDTIKEETLSEANAVLNAVKEAELAVSAMVKTINKYLSSGEISYEKSQVLNQISYNAMRGIIQVISYVSFMMIRKLNNISSAIISCNDIYIDISNIYCEGVFDTTIFPTDSHSLAEDLNKGNADAYISLADNIYQFHAGLGKVDVNTLDEDYNKDLYDDTSKMFIIISKGLDNIAASVSDNFLLIFDDIIEKSGFILRLEDRFRNDLDEIDDLSRYTGSLNINGDGGFDSHLYQIILSEIKDFGKNMDTIARNVLDTRTKIGMLSDRFESNINGEFSDSEAINELKIFMKDLDEQYDTLTNVVSSKYMARLKNLGDILIKMESVDKIEDTVPDTTPVLTSTALDVEESVFDSILESYEQETKYLFESLQESYYYEKEKALRGVNVVFEADAPTQNTPTANTTTPATPAANATTPVVNNATQNTGNAKPSTTPVVIDNSNSNNNNNTGDNSSSTKITEKLGEWIRTKVSEFVNTIKGAKKTKNTKWLNDNGDELSTRSYSNVAIQILPYDNMPEATIMNDMDSLNKNIRSMTPQVMNGINDKKTLYAKLFPFVTTGVNDSEALADQFKKYYKVGNGNLECKTIANSELKNFVNSTMVPYCKNYYDQLPTELETKANAISTTLDEIIDTYNNSQPTTESVSIFTEADTAQASQPSLKDKYKWLAEAVRYYNGAIMNALKDRTKDYLKILDALTPNTSVKPAKTQAEQNATNTANNQPQPTQAVQTEQQPATQPTA